MKTKDAQPEIIKFLKKRGYMNRLQAFYPKGIYPMQVWGKNIVLSYLLMFLGALLYLIAVGKIEKTSWTPFAQANCKLAVNLIAHFAPPRSRRYKLSFYNTLNINM